MLPKGMLQCRETLKNHRKTEARNGLEALKREKYIRKLFQSELRFLGIESSPSYVREPECNGVSERFVKTLKQQFLHVGHFETIEELRNYLLGFKEEYNRSWLCQKHNYKTPIEVRTDYFYNQQVA